MKMFIEHFKTGISCLSTRLGDDFSSYNYILSFDNNEVLVLCDTSNSRVVKTQYLNNNLKENVINITINHKEDWIKYFTDMFDNEKSNILINEFNSLCNQLENI